MRLEELKSKYRNKTLEDIHLEALKMINSRIAQILSGDANYCEKWREIAGFAMIIQIEIQAGRLPGGGESCE